MKKILSGLVFIIACLSMSSVVFAESDYKAVEKYANDLGYAVINSSYENIHNDTIVVLRPMVKKEITATPMAIANKVEATYDNYIVSVRNVNETQEFSFLANITVEGNDVFLVLYDNEGGIKINLANKSIDSVWASHHSCDSWHCVYYYIIANWLKDFSLWLRCGTEIAGCVGSGGTVCEPLIDCATGLLGSGIVKCIGNSCYWYRCQQDCSTNNYLADYSNYCSGNQVWRAKYYNSYKCPDNVGYGVYSNCMVDYQKSYWTNIEYVETCSQFCSGGVCNVPTTTTTIPDTCQLTSPQAKAYDTHSITVNFNVNHKVKYIKRALNSNAFYTVCTDCSSYFKTNTFSDGNKQLALRAVDYNGNIFCQKTVDFSVDTVQPSISRISPAANSYVMSPSEFSITYSEKNLKSISLFYGLPGQYKELVMGNCEAGLGKTCKVNVDLSSYIGQTISYYFVVSDAVHSKTSKVASINVISPQIKCAGSSLTLSKISASKWRVRYNYGTEVLTDVNALFVGSSGESESTTCGVNSLRPGGLCYFISPIANPVAARVRATCLGTVPIIATWP